jgi:hypothetical protein
METSGFIKKRVRLTVVAGTLICGDRLGRRIPPAAVVVIIMSHVATKPLVAISTAPRKTKAVTSELLTKYSKITKSINDNY